MGSRPSLTSRIVLLGAFGAASVGWLGLDLAPPVRVGSLDAAAPGAAVVGNEPAVSIGQGWQPGVRDRSAWQPSPIPSTSGAAKSGSVLHGQPQPSAATAQLPPAP